MNRKLVIIEPWFHKTNPSWESLIRALPYLQTGGYEVIVWCWTCDPHPLVKPIIFRRRKVGRVLEPWLFAFQAHWRRFVVEAGSWKDVCDVSISNGFYCTGAHFCYLQFSHFDYAAKQFQMPFRSLRDALECAMEFTLGLLSDIIIYWSPTRNNLLAASKAVMRDAAKFSAPWKQAKLLPNSIDTSVWNPAARQHHRPIERARFGWDESDIIFVFASQGHHRRKGFTLAVQAVAKLRPTGNARLLVIGGTKDTIERLQRELDRDVPDHREFVTFTGMLSDPLPAFSAADALLFPSYSEAFSLVEIQAAALGLRLYLTPHHGSEMLLTPTVNGRLIPWNSAEIATLLRSDYQAGRLIAGNEPVPGVIDPQRFSERLLAILDQESSKGQHSNLRRLPSRRV